MMDMIIRPDCVCGGTGRLPFPGRAVDDVISEIPCGACLARWDAANPLPPAPSDPRDAEIAVLRAERDRMRNDLFEYEKAPSPEAAMWDWIRAEPKTRPVTCRSCKTTRAVPALTVYDDCPSCGRRTKLRSYGAMGTEREDVLDAAREWLGVRKIETERDALRTQCAELVGSDSV